MRFFVYRRLRNSLITVSALGLIAWQVGRLRAALLPSSFFTGWLLLGAVAFLALYHARKKFPVPLLGSSSTWLQAHVYVALAAAGVFVMHAPWRLPQGILESTLWALCVTTFASGVVGLYWTRTLPKRLAAVGEEILFERASGLRHQLRQRAEASVLGVVRTAGETTLGEFYHRRLQGYFESAPRRRDRWFPSVRLRKSLLAELTEVTRYLSDAERKVAEDLFALVRKRDAVDYQEALQWRLKRWLFVHLALTYPLVLVAVLHAWLAHLFSGGLP
jgi:hypothetical protein